MNRNGYNREAVQAMIDKDPRIKGKEAKLIHRLMQGREAKAQVQDLPLFDLEGQGQGDLVDLAKKEQTE